jgi:hypothetical protein
MQTRSKQKYCGNFLKFSVLDVCKSRMFVSEHIHDLQVFGFYMIYFIWRCIAIIAEVVAGFLKKVCQCRKQLLNVPQLTGHVYKCPQTCVILMTHFNIFRSLKSLTCSWKTSWRMRCSRSCLSRNKLELVRGPDSRWDNLEIHHSIQGICCGAPSPAISVPFLFPCAPRQISLQYFQLKMWHFFIFVKKCPFLAKIAVPLWHRNSSPVTSLLASHMSSNSWLMSDGQ